MFNHNITTHIKTYECKKISHDANGNPRYIVPYYTLGLTTYPERTPKSLTKLGLSKYRGREFGGGYVFQSYNLSESLDFYYDKINGAITLADLATKYRDWYATHKFLGTCELVPLTNPVWELDLYDAPTDANGKAKIAYPKNPQSLFEFRHIGDKFFY